MVSSVFSGSNEIIRTVWFSQPTMVYDIVSTITKAYIQEAYQVWCFADFPEPLQWIMPAQYFPILIFIQLAIQIQLEVHQLSRAQSYHNLALVGRRSDNSLALWHPPFVYATVC